MQIDVHDDNSTSAADSAEPKTAVLLETPNSEKPDEN